MTNEINAERILSWYSGKARKDAEAALNNLKASMAHGSWLPKHSRTTVAALSKANEAVKIGRRAGEGLERLGDYKTDQSCRGFNVMMILRYGSYARGAHMNFEGCRALAVASKRQDLVPAIEAAERFCQDLAGVGEAILRLNATRPVPVFTNLGVSPTITTTLRDMGVVGSIETLRVPEIEKEIVERTDAQGNKYYTTIAFIVWPPGTKHNRSRHCYSSRNFEKCHSCGHAIKNPWNWVPLLIDDAAGVPHSMWVGRDCARSLFGIDMTGEMEIKNRTEAA